MNREIKFRAWIPGTCADGVCLEGCMLYELIWQEVVAVRTQTSVVPESLGFEHARDRVSDLNKQLATYEHLMQYTGLKDKNGVEIYEGDIVKFYWGEYDSPDTLFGILTEPPREAGYDHEGATEMVDIVEFHQGAFMSMCPTTGGGAYLKRNNEKCEVIGNIYENPELLTS